MVSALRHATEYASQALSYARQVEAHHIGGMETAGIAAVLLLLALVAVAVGFVLSKKSKKDEGPADGEAEEVRPCPVLDARSPCRQLYMHECAKGLHTSSEADEQA